LQIMTTAAENERPLLTYCRLGKDRTGLMTALVLSTCGATEDEIVSDYARCAAWALLL
jgi:protein-tyrosine phosphatase